MFVRFVFCICGVSNLIHFCDFFNLDFMALNDELLVYEFTSFSCFGVGYY